MNSIKRDIVAGDIFSPLPRKARISGQEEPVYPSQQEFRDAFQEVVDFYGEHMPHLTRDGGKGMVLLPSALYPKKVNVYEELVQTNRLRPSFPERYFKILWTRYYGNVVIKKWTPFAKCDECVQFRNRILSTSRKDKVKVEKLKADQSAHRTYIANSRLRLKEREKLARDFPDQFLFLIFDGMDNKKSWVPRYRSDAFFAKDLDAEGKFLKSKLTGFLIPGRGFLNFWTVPSIPHGADLNCTMLLVALQKVS